MNQPYHVIFSRTARKQLENLPLDIQKRLADRLKELSENPYDPRFAKKLQGQRGFIEAKSTAPYKAMDLFNRLAHARTGSRRPKDSSSLLR